MNKTKTRVLDKKQIEQKVNRISWQIYEDSFQEKEIIVAGIAKTGFLLAQRIVAVLGKISPLKITLVKIILDKENPLSCNIEPQVSLKELKGKIVVLVDDVLNSGMTLTYSLRPFLDSGIKKIRTVILVDRNHRRFPTGADFTGISLATTMQEHITVDLESGDDSVTLS
ncbi:MAG: phosphoribosyltransferase [Bacteroidia bacterium]|nr:phosphoribosyltransferase [Bacteroidia bacterium]